MQSLNKYKTYNFCVNKNNRYDRTKCIIRNNQNFFEAIKEHIMKTTLIKSLMPNKQKGATMVEYAIMVALIAIVAITAVTLLGTKVSGTFNSIASSLPG